MRTGAVLGLIIAAVIAVMLLVPGSRLLGTASAASTLERPFDPVVLTGSDVPSLAGIDPDDLVAFRYDGGWEPLPVQVDERAVKDFGDIYNVSAGVTGLQPQGLSFPPPTGVTELVYTDDGTFTGPDPDPTLDADDEVVFMAKDAGGLAEGGEPSGVVSGSGVELTITDPLAGGTGYVYLFRSDGTLDPSAGQQYVSYTFDLLSGPYLTSYDTLNGPNPEDSVVTTPYYSHHFSDRWISDEIQITMGAATGVDILDRHKNLFAPGVCVRSEDTFADGEGAFVVNKSGPVRALRSFVGANSGPLSQREHVFYERRQDMRGFLRVHAIPGVMDFFDYSPAASGMTYYNDLNTAGVTIDGSPDVVTPGAIEWEMVTGAQGSLLMVETPATNIDGFAFTSYYLDDSTPAEAQCTGDGVAYGSSGAWVNQAIPCTDPAFACTDFLSSTRTMYYDAPGMTVPEAQALSSAGTTPLTYAAAPYTATPPAATSAAPTSSQPPDATATPLALPGVGAASGTTGGSDDSGLLIGLIAGAVVLGGAAWYAGRRRTR